MYPVLTHKTQWGIYNTDFCHWHKISRLIPCMQRIFFPNYFFIKLLMSQQEGMLMLLCLRNLRRWWAGVSPLPSSLRGPGGFSPTDLICRLPWPWYGWDNRQESRSWSNSCPVSLWGWVHCGFLCPSKKPQLLSRGPPQTALSPIPINRSLYIRGWWLPVCASLRMLRHLLRCLPKLCPHLLFFSL